MKSKVIKILLILFIVLVTNNIKCYADILKMEVDNGTAWTNITVSTAYELCEKLNDVTSTLGTKELEAHLTTDADWSAMALFSASQYGGATKNLPDQTNGNVTGVYGISTKSFSTGLLETATKSTNSYISGLFNEDGTVKKYVKKWNTDRTKTNVVWFNETFGFYSSSASYAGSISYPCSIKCGLFSVMFGPIVHTSHLLHGNANTSVTFRPVIWN